MAVPGPSGTLGVRPRAVRHRALRQLGPADPANASCRRPMILEPGLGLFRPLLLEAAVMLMSCFFLDSKPASCRRLRDAGPVGHPTRIGCILRDRCRPREAGQWGKRAAHHVGRVRAGERILHLLDAAPSLCHGVSAAHPCGGPGRVHWRRSVPRSRACIRLGEPSLLAAWRVMRSRARRPAAP